MDYSQALCRYGWNRTSFIRMWVIISMDCYDLASYFFSKPEQLSTVPKSLASSHTPLKTSYLQSSNSSSYEEDHMYPLSTLTSQSCTESRSYSFLTCYPGLRSGRGNALIKEYGKLFAVITYKSGLTLYLWKYCNLQIFLVLSFISGDILPYCSFNQSTS